MLLEWKFYLNEMVDKNYNAVGFQEVMQIFGGIGNVEPLLQKLREVSTNPELVRTATPQEQDAFYRALDSGMEREFLKDFFSKQGIQTNF